MGCSFLESILIECNGGVMLEAVDDRRDVTVVSGAVYMFGFLFGGAEHPGISEQESLL